MGHTLVLNVDFNPVTFLPLSTFTWQDSVKAICLGTVQVIHEYDDWIVHSPSIAIKVPSVVASMKNIRTQRRIQCTSEMIKLRDSYTCQYCQKRFPSWKLTQDHVLPKSLGGGNGWDNIVAACHDCNTKRGADVRIRPFIEPWKPTFYQMMKIRREFPLNVPDPSWIPYLGWEEEKINVQPPVNEPGLPEQSFRKKLLL